MAPASSLVNKLKVQLKLSISRLRMVQQKDSAKAKQQRREMAQLLEAGKIQSARIRVENIIRSDITTELHEMLELYCELVLARSQLLEPPSSPYSSPAPKDASTTQTLDPALNEAICSLIYAAPRTEVKELHNARALLVEKFGKEVALASMEGEGVAERVLKKLKTETPSEKLVDAYLKEIARFYGVPFGSEDDDDDDDGGMAELEAEVDAEEAALEAPLEAERASSPSKPETTSSRTAEEDEVAALSHATPPRKFGPQSPLRITPPSPSTDNVAPKLKLPGAKKPTAVPVSKPKPAPKSDRLGKIPDVDELARRFAELKK
ncbi:DUF292-domain-containing protein [Delitschia confertaspora ATCC 74209]|uniref:DUF292-domain-containing protein n=1 Tax=Delitschia confertaspora ATCC 74209 TaxID=1513339 RepID=A0A9P4N0S6_9PLEO|nr:DUF292-domain-containing protein [Delitschia confertaspora ATCC 74209]